MKLLTRVQGQVKEKDGHRRGGKERKRKGREGKRDGRRIHNFPRGLRYCELPGDSPSQNFEQLSFTCYPRPILPPVPDRRVITCSLASCVYVE